MNTIMSMSKSFIHLHDDLLQTASLFELHQHLLVVLTHHVLNLLQLAHLARFHLFLQLLVSQLGGLLCDYAILIHIFGAFP